MTSISFPHSHSFPSYPSSSSPGEEEGTFPMDSIGSSSGFQMNPLSAHPPRTPRASVIASNGPTYSSEPFAPPLENNGRPPNAEEEDDHVDEVKPETGKQARLEDVWREILKSSYGRDKAFKIMQYTMKVYLLFHHAISRRAPLNTNRAWETELLRRLDSTVGGLSLARSRRKCLILFNWLPPLTSILAENAASVIPRESSSKQAHQQPKPLLYTFLHAPLPVLLELLNACADDVATFSKLGLFGKRTGERAGRVADWCWFLSTLVNLVENTVERNVIVNSQRAVESRAYTESMAGATAKSAPRNTKIDEQELAKLARQDYWLQMHRTKLLMDLIFVSYDVFRLRRGKDAVRAFTGLASALLSSAKLYDRHKNDLVKTLRF
ncbi:hypothetical protein OF83DRAFT_1192041 [Amylostereum chailletii]|nr:hypothetical protein OF83DRAFT_1192041 [Amylostereum chailletii]